MNALDGLAEFLVDAKKSAFAQGATPKREKDHSNCYTHEKGDWAYKDQYYGSNHFIGHETVWMKGKPVWGMNYHGLRLDTLFDEQRLIHFLRETLQKVEASHPFRGPDKYTSNNLTYANYITGDLTNFRGVEIIFETGRAVYQLEYHGGVVTE